MKTEKKGLFWPDNSFRENKFSRICFNLFLAVFSFIFVYISGLIILANDSHNYESLLMFILVAADIAVLCGVYKLISKYILFLDKNFFLIVGLSLAFIFIINVICGVLLRYNPMFDIGAVFTGASEWSANGTFTENINWTCDKDYFYYFPNNLGVMTLLFVFFEIFSIFSYTDYFVIATIANGLLLIVSFLLVLLICRKILGTKKSMMALAMMLLFPAFYFVAPTFYTHSLSIIFPPLMFFLYLKYVESTSLKHKIIYACLFALSCAVGMLVMFTVIIFAIAIAVYHLIAGNKLSLAFLSGITAVIVCIAFVIFNAYFYSVHLDKEKAEKMNTPILHWVMMSLQGEGRYNGEDYVFTRSFDDNAERTAATIKVIKERIREKKIIGMMNLFQKKQLIIFGDGALGTTGFYEFQPENDTILHEYISKDGEKYSIYSYACSAMLYAFIILMVVSAVSSIKNKKYSPIRIIPLVAVFGMMLFFSMWEVSERYMANYVLMILISAVSGISAICDGSRLTEVKLPVNDASDHIKRRR